MRTQDGITKGIVIACIAVLSLAIVATVAALSHDAHDIEANAAPGHIEPSEDNSFLVTPNDRTRVYKFYDDVGAICFLAESQVGNGVGIYCIPGAK
jgi:hypothetical protein